MSRITHKTKIAILEDTGNLQFQCSCGILGNVFIQSADLMTALSAAEAELTEHLEGR